MRFERGNTIGKAGRPRGSRNRLANTFLTDLLEIWNEPIKEGSEVRRGPAAMRIMSRERPNEFVKIYASVMPKEFWFDSTVTELDDGELDALIAQMRERLLVAREEKSLDQAAQMKMIEHVN
jgi:hypothetical protein